jgi:hypothetical protein
VYEYKFETSRHMAEKQAIRYVIPWGMFLLRLSWLVAVLSPWTPRIFPRPVHGGLVEEVVMVHVSLTVFSISS